MKINIKRTDDDYQMLATNENGNTIVMDGADTIGGHNSGMRPMQLLLSALGGCSAIDVILVLKKQRQTIDSFEIEVDGEREQIDNYSLFRDITIHFKLKGDIEYAKAERAVKMSLEKYCSVAKTLEPTAKINFKLSVNEETMA